MRGTGTQINTLYNGIKIGPSEMTGRIMDTANLDRVEILRAGVAAVRRRSAAPSATSGAAYRPVVSRPSRRSIPLGVTAGYGSGGSTLVDGLDYRFDVSRSTPSFIDDTYSKLTNVSGQLSYASPTLSRSGAPGGTSRTGPLSTGARRWCGDFPGIVPTNGIVSGTWNYYLNGRSGARTRSRSTPASDHELQRARQPQQRQRIGCAATFQWDITNILKSLSMPTPSVWFSNEIQFYDDRLPGNQVYRERLRSTTKLRQRHHDCQFEPAAWTTGWSTVAASSLRFNAVQDDAFTSDTVNLVNPDPVFMASNRPFIPTSTMSLAFGSPESRRISR
jgi:iron complex outermembrane receptor protein